MRLARACIMMSLYAVFGWCISIGFPFLDLEQGMVLTLLLLIPFIYYCAEAKMALSAMVTANLIMLAFPGYEYSLLIFVSLVPLFYIIHRESSYWWMVIYGMITGIVFNVGAFSWLKEAVTWYGSFTGLQSRFLVVLYAVFFSGRFVVMLLGLKWIQKNLKISNFISFPIWIAFVGSVTYEYMPWYFSNVLHTHSYLVQIVEWVGIFGLDMFIVFVNLVIYRSLQGLRQGFVLWISFQGYYDKLHKHIDRLKLENIKEFFLGPSYNQGIDAFKLSMSCLIKKPISILIAMLLVFNVWGWWRIEQIQLLETQTKPMHVAVIQPNFINGGLNTLLKNYERLISKVISKTEQQTKKKIDLIAWPEIPIVLFKNGTLYQRWFKFVRRLADKYNTSLFFSMSNKDGNNLYNSTFFIRPSLITTQVLEYRKMNLYPFGEYIPFGEQLPFLYDIAGFSSFFTPGKEMKIFELDEVKLIPQVCYEAILKDFVQQFVAKGGNLMVNLTNDMWFGKTKATYQHLKLVAMRAIENRIPIVRVTNTGVSAVITPTGKIEQMTPMYQEAAFIATVYPTDQLTAPIHIKTWFYRLIVGFFVLMIVYRYVKKS